MWARNFGGPAVGWWWVYGCERVGEGRMEEREKGMKATLVFFRMDTVFIFLFFWRELI